MRCVDCGGPFSDPILKVCEYCKTKEEVLLALDEAECARFEREQTEEECEEAEQRIASLTDACREVAALLRDSHAKEDVAEAVKILSAVI